MTENAVVENYTDNLKNKSCAKVPNNLCNTSCAKTTCPYSVTQSGTIRNKHRSVLFNDEKLQKATKYKAFQQNSHFYPVAIDSIGA